MVNVHRDIGHESIVIQFLAYETVCCCFYELGDSGLKEEQEQKKMCRSDFVVLFSVISFLCRFPSMSILSLFLYFLFSLTTAGLFKKASVTDVQFCIMFQSVSLEPHSLNRGNPELEQKSSVKSSKYSC